MGGRCAVCTSGVDVDIGRVTKSKALYRMVGPIVEWFKEAVGVYPNIFSQICQSRYGVAYMSHCSYRVGNLEDIGLYCCTTGSWLTAFFHAFMSGFSVEVLRSFVKARYGDIIEPGRGLKTLEGVLPRYTSFHGFKDVEGSYVDYLKAGLRELYERGFDAREMCRAYQCLVLRRPRERPITVKVPTIRGEELRAVLSESPLRKSSTLKMAYYVGLYLYDRSLVERLGIAECISGLLK